jgi:hypothetical protein
MVMTMGLSSKQVIQIDDYLELDMDIGVKRIAIKSRLEPIIFRPPRAGNEFKRVHRRVIGLIIH